MITKPTVCFVESVGILEEQAFKEGEIIERTLQLSGKHSAYAYVRSKQQLAAVANEFGESKHRYFHLSCHGVVVAIRQSASISRQSRSNLMISHDFLRHIWTDVAFFFLPASLRVARLQPRY